MFTEARKIQLIEEVLKVKNDATLVEIESVLKNSKKKKDTAFKKLSIYDFVGIFTKKESSQMRMVIEETCETINPDDWK